MSSSLNRVASFAAIIWRLEDGRQALSISQQCFATSRGPESIFLESAMAAVQGADDIRWADRCRSQVERRPANGLATARIFDVPSSPPLEIWVETCARMTICLAAIRRHDCFSSLGRNFDEFDGRSGTKRPKFGHRELFSTLAASADINSSIRRIGMKNGLREQWQSLMFR